MALFRVGDVAELSVMRDGKPMTVRATVAAIASRAAGRSNAPSCEPFIRNFLGLCCADPAFAHALSRWSPA
jgi:hypothetical protein